MTSPFTVALEGICRDARLAFVKGHDDHLNLLKESFQLTEPIRMLPRAHDNLRFEQADR